MPAENLPQENSDSTRLRTEELITSLRGHLELALGDGITAFPPSGILQAKSAPAQDIVPTREDRADELIRKKIKQLEELKVKAEACRLCPISKTRKKLVFGVGNPNADLVFVGEAPGNDEDIQGEPFVGRAGKYLNKIIEFMGLKRDDVYIMNTIKCHPPENRNPTLTEMDNCETFFHGQLEVIQPKVICALGTFAAQRLLRTDTPIGRLRGKFHEYRGIPVMPTYHPAYLLRNPTPENRDRVKADVTSIMEKYLRQ